eukprot:s1817_g2.t1
MSGNDNAAQTEDEIIWLHRHRPGNYSVNQLRKRRQLLASSVTGLENPAAQKLASVIFNALVKIDPGLKDCLASDLQCKEDPQVLPRPPLLRQNAFLVENETQCQSDKDGTGSASHDQCQLLVYDDDSTMVVDEDFYQEDSFFQLNTI